ncbi:DNA sulfur modification protein DndB [Bacillus sp. T33-2]|uniref:DNA sulfur modification protein DndB n=1 Tax=Bacillus sp. T33-2 TaxID=2054168 RepID=UPI000C757FB8|nr:DNA sulfur modification protein DndB [Bacillus sp. T33-2]PLR99550.1 hypothetical protein CVD19_00370 [Bacillus sp. T33-2]
MLRDRKELEENLIPSIKSIKSKKKVINDIKTQLASYDILAGDIQGWINDPQSELPNLDIRQMFLFAEQIYLKTGNLEINPEVYFTESEVKEARQFSGVLERQDEINFPITITNATVVGNSAFATIMDIKTINKLLSNHLLSYNFEVQREAKFKRREDKVIIEPTISMNNVKEITQHLLEGTLVPTKLVFNAATRTAESGTELVYDPKKLELTITKGTRMDIVDGYHRCMGLQNALQTNPELNFNFIVLITNYSTKRAQQYQAQLAKATPISKTRIQELEANRLSDTVVQQLKDESDLQGKISQTHRIHSINKELVSYNVLADTIDEQFRMETRADAADIGDYLVEFFNFLIDSNPSAFINDIEENKKTSLINDNNMFVGYLVLARRMMEHKIKPREVRNYIKDINFIRDNPLWVELGILNDKGNISDTVRARKAIKQYFEEINL